MTRLSGLRKTANLSESIRHRLNMYALAAMGTGTNTVQPSRFSPPTPGHICARGDCRRSGHTGLSATCRSNEKSSC
jgi:hypothetical protein